ncbi:MAG TPA: membrane protein insertion efficiency factor YidD [Dehalococcoidia bacterium]|nr:membrane protein insertion efficiency factor YidD [Dehalococcoidia bacterium]
MRFTSPCGRWLLRVIRLYQRAISPALPSSCRFQPTCSQYAYEAIELHGVSRGVWLAARRLLRCTPLRAAGYDPVPLPPRPMGEGWGEGNVSRETSGAHSVATLASKEA